MFVSFLLSSLIGCWVWSVLMPHRRQDPIPSPAKLNVSVRLMTAVDVASLTIFFAAYRDRAAGAFVGWLLVRFVGVFILHRNGWYWLADWLSSMGR